jgi:hypothetical protein
LPWEEFLKRRAGLYNPLKLLPVEDFDSEFVEKICREDILGVAFSFFAETGVARRAVLWRYWEIDLIHLYSFGVYGVSDTGERFTRGPRSNGAVFHVFAPVLNPHYTDRPFEGWDIFREMARRYMEAIEEEVDDIYKFILDNVYNLYIYYFSIGAKPAVEIFSYFMNALKHEGIELPLNSPEKYFDTLFTYFKIIGFRVSDYTDLFRVWKVSRGLSIILRNEKEDDMLDIE